MRRIVVALVAVSASLALAACEAGAPASNSEGDSSVASEPGPPGGSDTAASSSDDLGSGQAPAASPSEPEAQQTTNEPEGEQETNEPEVADAGTEANGPSHVLSDRGYLVVGLGDWIEVGEGPAVSFRLTAIEPNFQCTSEDAEDPQNGNFIALTFEIETHAQLAQAPVAEFILTEYDMKLFDDSGQREGDSTGSAYLCLAEEDKLPSSLGPAEHATGKIVLDSGITSGAIAYDTYRLEGIAGWEWPLAE